MKNYYLTFKQMKTDKMVNIPLNETVIRNTA